MAEEKEMKDQTQEEQNQNETSQNQEASSKQVSEKFKDLIEKIESLTVVELAELVSELEERLGVSGMPMMAAPVVASGTAGQTEGSAGAEEKTHFNIVIKEAGENKIAAIKVVREVKPDLGLKEAKDFVESLPKTLKENVKKEEAEEIKKKLEEAGLKVELQ